MQTKLVKSLIAGTIGAALSAISLYGMNPAGMAAYGAIQESYGGSVHSTVSDCNLLHLWIYWNF